jgi:hypothetical protein
MIIINRAPAIPEMNQGTDRKKRKESRRKRFMEVVA